MDEQAYLNQLQKLWQKNWPEHFLQKKNSVN